MDIVLRGVCVVSVSSSLYGNYFSEFMGLFHFTPSVKNEYCQKVKTQSDNHVLCEYSSVLDIYKEAIGKYMLIE